MDYHAYLKSKEWQIKRQAVLMWWGYKCALCGSKEHIEVHHNTYERVGKELFSDLIPLCDPCHTRQHGLPGTPGKIMAFLDNIAQQIKAGID